MYRFENVGSSAEEYGGNLEIVPYSDEWPAGRVVYGSNMSTDLPDFLKDQTRDGTNAIQSPFSIDVGWLYVGHVDEIVSFLRGGSRGYQVLIASPRIDASDRRGFAQHRSQNRGAGVPPS